MRDHKPIRIDQFNGLFSRGNEDSVPPDHASDCNNLAFGQGEVHSRGGFTPYAPVPNCRRMYTFNQETGQSVLALDDIGNIYDNGSPTPLVPILTVIGMTDFGFVSIAGRAYLTPSNGETGLEDEFIYVYEGDGTPARKAAGTAPTNAEGALAAANSATVGNVEAGYHVFGAVYETTSGFLSSIGPGTLPFVLAPGGKKVTLTNIPVSASATVVNVHIVATKLVPAQFWTGDTDAYEFFFVPGAIVANGVTTLNVSFFDSELLESADDLFDLYSEIPATAWLGTYNNRMIGGATFDDISLVLVSNIGEPEGINTVDGLIVLPLDGKPSTNGQEYRDALYLYKQIRTYAYVDNGDVPSSWDPTAVDQGIGASLHGIATVLDSGGVNVDYLITCDYSGIFIFNGSYIRPELSWKIKTFWLALDRTAFDLIQIINDSVSQILYITLPDRRVLIGDYSNGQTPKDIRWCPWSTPFQITTAALVNTNTLILGSLGEA